MPNYKRLTDESGLSAADKKMSLLKYQINIRKKVYKENIKIPFNFMSSSELSNEYCDVDPATLVGKSIELKFESDGGEYEWFPGFVVD